MKDLNPFEKADQEEHELTDGLVGGWLFNEGRDCDHILGLVPYEGKEQAILYASSLKNRSDGSDIFIFKNCPGCGRSNFKKLM